MTHPDEANALRAARVERVLNRYCMGDELDTTLVDLLADAMHWCDFNSRNFHWAFAQACRHYIHEHNDQQQDERRMIP